MSYNIAIASACILLILLGAPCSIFDETVLT